MNILSKWQQQWAINRLRKEVRRDPHISSFVSLIERHLFQGDVVQARDVAEDAVRRYPDSERLASLLARVRRVAVRVEIDELRRRIAASPSPEGLCRLADLYLSLGEAGRALRLAAECGRRFPAHENGPWIEGRVRIQRYREHHLAKDGRETASTLEEVVRRNADHVRARRLLADFYLELGAKALARPHLEALAASVDADDAVRGALDSIECDGAEAENAPRLDDLLRAAETTGAAAATHPASVDTSMRLERLRELASRLVASHKGIVAAVVFRRDEQPDMTRWEGAAGKIASLADSALRQMDLGGLHDFRLSGPFGHLFAFRAEDAWLLLLCSESARFEEVKEASVEAISESRLALASGGR